MIRRRGGSGRGAAGRGATLALAGLGAVLIVAAGAFDAEPLYVPGVGLVALVVVLALMLLLGRRGASVRRVLEAPRVVEGDAVALRIEVRRGWLPLPGSTVADPLVPEPLAVRGRGRGASLATEARLRHRGLHALAPPALVLRDPLGLASRTVRGDGEDHVLVLPRTSPVSAPGGGAPALWAAGRRPHAVGAEIDPDGLRPYRPGAPATRVYWPALARGAGLVERRRQPEPESRPLVVLDARGATCREELDAAVRAAASLCLELARRGGCAALLPGERRPAPIDRSLAAWPAIHARLALVAGDAPAPVLTGLGMRRGAVLYVVARELARLPRALELVPRGSTRILVTPARMPGRALAFEVAGCHGHQLGAPARRRAAAAREGVG